MTDTKLTLEDLMDYVDCELNLADIEAQEIYTSLKELAAIKSQPVPEGYTDIKDYIAEQEKDPVRKAALDKARVRLREELAKGPVPVEPVRYGPDINGEMGEWVNGEYVYYSDYQALQSALQEAEKREKSKHQQYSALLERHTKIAEQLQVAQQERDEIADRMARVRHSADRFAEQAEKAEAELAALQVAKHNGGVTMDELGEMRDHAEAIEELVSAAENLRDVKGRHHTEIATTQLFEALAKLEKP